MARTRAGIPWILTPIPLSLLTQQTLRLLPGRTPRPGAGSSARARASDAIRLALLGYEVDAVELSSVGAKKIERFAEEAGVKVRVLVTDIRDFTPEGSYDVIVCNGVLHYVPEKRAVVKVMQQATWPGGLNVVSLWSTHTPVPGCHDFVPVYCDDEQGVVASSYESWRTEFVYFERDKSEAAHFDLPAHRHSHIKLIASKPGA